MLGETLFGLKPVCGICHKAIEFEGGNKLPPRQATAKACATKKTARKARKAAMAKARRDRRAAAKPSDRLFGL